MLWGVSHGSLCIKTLLTIFCGLIEKTGEFLNRYRFNSVCGAEIGKLFGQFTLSAETGPSYVADFPNPDRFASAERRRA